MRKGIEVEEGSSNVSCEQRYQSYGTDSIKL